MCTLKNQSFQHVGFPQHFTVEVIPDKLCCVTLCGTLFFGLLWVRYTTNLGIHWVWLDFITSKYRQNNYTLLLLILPILFYNMPSFQLCPYLNLNLSKFPFFYLSIFYLHILSSFLYLFLWSRLLSSFDSSLFLWVLLYLSFGLLSLSFSSLFRASDHSDFTFECVHFYRPPLAYLI